MGMNIFPGNSAPAIREASLFYWEIITRLCKTPLVFRENDSVNHLEFLDHTKETFQPPIRGWLHDVVSIWG